LQQGISKVNSWGRERLGTKKGKNAGDPRFGGLITAAKLFSGVCISPHNCAW